MTVDRSVQTSAKSRLFHAMEGEAVHLITLI